MNRAAHFASAVAAATFVPGAVALAAGGHGAILLLAGVFGLLPDWLDVMWARHLEPADETIAPDPGRADAQVVADRLAGAAERADRSGEPVVVQIDPRRGAGRFQRYRLRFDTDPAAVTVRPLPPVGAIWPPPAQSDGRALIQARLDRPCEAEIGLDGCEGPLFEFRRTGDAVEAYFLPWYRGWTHSLLLGGSLGLCAGLLLGMTAGLAVAVAYAIHVFADQLGRLGANLWWPFTGRRSPGLSLRHFGDPASSFLVVWTSAALILYNLNRFAEAPYFEGSVFLLWAALVPAGILIGAMAYRSASQGQAPPEAEWAEDVLADAEGPPG